MFRLEFLHEVVVICNDSVVHDSDAFLGVEVRMGVDVGLVSMGSPSGVADGDLVVVSAHSLHLHALDAIASEAVRGSEFSQIKFSLALFILRDRYHSTGVVASAFEDLETLDANWTSLVLVAKVADDTAALVGFGLLLSLVVHPKHAAEEKRGRAGQITLVVLKLCKLQS
jgi:hypothetical protein